MENIQGYFERCNDALSTESGYETILVRLGSGRFYGLGDTGTPLWNRLAQPARVEDLAAVLVSHYGSSPETATSDATAFLEELLGEGLVAPAAAPAYSHAPEIGAAAMNGRPYAAPRLDRGTLRQAAAGEEGSLDGPESGLS
jgi:hypothetical protein